MTLARTMRRITTYIEGDRSFIIFECIDDNDAKGFWAIEDKYIVDGHLVKELNGITGFLNKTCRETIAAVSRQIKIDALVASGMDLMQAAIQVCMAER